jgi:hypothetical protein
MLWYNDNLDSASSASFAHAKGMVAYSSSYDPAVWLLHSFPKYPGSRKPLDFKVARPQLQKGQYAACFSLAGDAAVVQDLLFVLQKHVKVRFYPPALDFNPGTSNFKLEPDVIYHRAISDSFFFLNKPMSPDKSTDSGYDLWHVAFQVLKINPSGTEIQRLIVGSEMVRAERR